MVGFSSFGQTFFIGLFGGVLREDFSLSHSTFGALYSLATLASAALLIITGPKIDTVPLRRYALMVIVFLGGACLTLGFANSLLVLTLGLFLLRHTGQGLMTHTGLTTMSRYFTQSRGRAVAIALAGYLLGEILFPLMATSGIVFFGWRTVWLFIAPALLILLGASVFWLLAFPLEQEKVTATKSPHEDKLSQEPTMSLPQVLRHWAFYPLLLALAAPPFVMTGLFFHQIYIGEGKAWPIELFAFGFVFYAGVRFVSSLVTGALIDRWGARHVIKFILWPLFFSLLFLAVSDARLMAILYFAFAGMCVGMSGTVATPFWAEAYGVQHIGAIRSVVSSMMVVSTALSPLIFGVAFDQGLSVESLLILCLAYVGVMALVLTFLMPLYLKSRRGVS